MPKLAANLTLMFNEVDFLDRFAAAAKAGFKGVEFLFPYDYDKQVLKQKLDENGLTLVLHNLPLLRLVGDFSLARINLSIGALAALLLVLLLHNRHFRSHQNMALV